MRTSQAFTSAQKTMMEITKVTYSRSKQIGANESECVEVSADIDIQEDASEVLAYLQNWTDTRLKIRETVAKLDERKHDLQAEIYQREKQVAEARELVNRARDFLKQHGIEEAFNPDNIPF